AGGRGDTAVHPREFCPERHMNYRHITCILLFAAGISARAQSTFVPLNDDYYHWVDRYEVKAGTLMPQFFTSVKPYKRSAIIAFSDSLDKAGVFNSQADKFNYEYLVNDS